jgi:hypothetical protein
MRMGLVVNTLAEIAREGMTLVEYTAEAGGAIYK